MRVEIKRLTSWTEALNSARFTQRKSLKSGGPSIGWKKKLIRSEHSPLRCVMFMIDIYDIPNFSSVHLVRHHVGSQPFVSTSRPDIDGNQVKRTKQFKIDPCNLRLFINAQEIINISKQRLCNKTEKATNIIWNAVIDELRKTEPELVDACIPNCIYRGFCSEFKSCGFANTEQFKNKREQYERNNKNL